MELLMLQPLYAFFFTPVTYRVKSCWIHSSKVRKTQLHKSRSVTQHSGKELRHPLDADD